MPDRLRAEVAARVAALPGAPSGPTAASRTPRPGIQMRRAPRTAASRGGGLLPALVVFPGLSMKSGGLPLAQLVALPVVLSVSVNEALRREAMGRVSGAVQAGTFFDVGFWQPALPQVTLPETHFYVDEATGVVVGVPNPRAGVSATGTVPQFHLQLGQLQLGYELSGMPKIQDVTSAVPWDLPHDFRKVQAEVTALGRLLTELSALAAALATATPATPHAEQILTFSDDGEPRLAPQVVAHLLNGGSIYELPDAAAFLASAEPAEGAMLFDVLDIRVESPFWNRQRPYVRFDSKIDFGTILAALSLLLQVQSTTLPEDPPPPAGTEINITIEQPAGPLPDLGTGLRRLDGEAYREDLDSGGVRTAQQYLKSLGYAPGPIDGVAGPKTQGAVERFCHDMKIVCDSHEDEVFRRRLVDEVAKKFPIYAKDD